MSNPIVLDQITSLSVEKLDQWRLAKVKELQLGSAKEISQIVHQTRVGKVKVIWNLVTFWESPIYGAQRQRVVHPDERIVWAARENVGRVSSQLFALKPYYGFEMLYVGERDAKAEFLTERVELIETCAHDWGSVDNYTRICKKCGFVDDDTRIVARPATQLPLIFRADADLKPVEGMPGMFHFPGSLAVQPPQRRQESLDDIRAAVLKFQSLKVAGVMPPYNPLYLAETLEGYFEQWQAELAEYAATKAALLQANKDLATLRVQIDARVDSAVREVEEKAAVERANIHAMLVLHFPEVPFEDQAKPISSLSRRSARRFVVSGTAATKLTIRVR